MNFLAISGSARSASTNTALLRALSAVAPPGHTVTVFNGLADLPVFSPDFESAPLPQPVQHFVNLIGNSDGIIIASPEYVRAIPGGLKNAIDWLVSRDEIITKPIALAHASHRGDDMLGQLRLVLSTVSTGFTEDIFLRCDLMKQSPQDIARHFETKAVRNSAETFLTDFTAFCRP
ncbi:FMN-dependent NADPH-azoreductase [Thalassovita gelatinovora]|uniref:FMN-dependent NADPH-azoreductase n=1 Tax=Thalassovita gelatinovora TaxID=53501 RepID=A0A0P1F8G6_THAGE|nr:NADPH-dependent FMN reductase [Thalassovita gelatinovora]QIZ80348.1 NAD(P)H-dependent oxidoreductase [Thalassovita gelatinovora]CUH64284.1 FMN-dependent NADPH-azoreductase [Thalassovita gelatinovora]SEQ93894.1 NAD(P)H-dependent FMN reductase [Thalassovita gelatinovora]